MILVVDDEPDLAATCARVLRRLGHGVVAVGSVTDALTRLAASPPALLVSDIRLPDGSGLEVVRAARPIPAIVMTGQPSERGREEAMAAGASVYLPKPFEVGGFAAAVQRTLGATGADGLHV